ncbi:MAG: hypothetical protein HYV96_14305 [Opitutae bacterium]|nr:hypothetical protein [Opitutae bacterium]
MPLLENATLRVELLDPVSDRSRLGPRFAWGGYIWQVHDATAGPLFAGPEWPKSDPAPHNGQGLPESFRHRTTDGAPLLWRGETGLAPGAGALGLDAGGAVIVTEPCAWTIESQTPTRIVYRTAQAVLGWSYELERTVELRERTLLSTSRLLNRGDAPLALEWFAHLFFSLESGRARVQLPAGTGLPPNPGFALEGRELVLRRTFNGERDGHLDHLVLPRDEPFSARLSHPKLTHVDFATDFAPFKCVVWANGNTLSLEPFLALHLAPCSAHAWTLRYDFGTSSGIRSPGFSARTPAAE